MPLARYQTSTVFGLTTSPTAAAGFEQSLSATISVRDTVRRAWVAREFEVSSSSSRQGSPAREPLTGSALGRGWRRRRLALLRTGEVGPVLVEVGLLPGRAGRPRLSSCGVRGRIAHEAVGSIRRTPLDDAALLGRYATACRGGPAGCLSCSAPRFEPDLAAPFRSNVRPIAFSAHDCTRCSSRRTWQTYAPDIASDPQLVHRLADMVTQRVTWRLPCAASQPGFRFGSQPSGCRISPRSVRAGTRRNFSARLRTATSSS